MDNYGFKELNELRKEANYRFYKDAYSYYIQLFFLPFETKKIRISLLNIIRLYNHYNLIERKTIRLLKVKYGNDRKPSKEIEELLTSINDYYETIYFYFEKFLIIYDDLLLTKNPNRFHLPNEDLDLSFYLNIIKKYQ